MANKDKCLLIVDDSDLDRTILKAMIGDEFQVLESNNGYLAFDTLVKRRTPIHGVLLDISMPIISGFDILRLMKDNGLDDIPVFLITSEATPENVAKAQEFKIAEFFSKPFDRDEILKRIRAWLGVDIEFNLSAEDIAETRKYIGELESLYRIYLKNFDKEKREIHYRHMVGLMKVLLTRYSKLKPELNMTSEHIDIVSQAAYFCDIGEMLQPDQLSLALREGNALKTITQGHTEVGAKIISLNHAESCAYFVNICSNMCSHHHERFDGTGFPRRISGNRLSVFNQLCHLVDELDTRLSKLYGINSLQSNFVVKSIVRDEGLVSPELMELLEDSSMNIQDYYSKNNLR